MKKKFLIVTVPLIIFDLIVLGCSYLFNKSLDFELIFLINIVLSLLVCMNLKVKIIKKVFLIVILFVTNSLISISMLFLAMHLPGSRDHNYVMYEVCLPAMAKYYGVEHHHLIPTTERNNEGYGKWWYQHLECEDNVYKGKGPIFSENPPGFMPVSK